MSKNGQWLMVNFQLSMMLSNVQPQELTNQLQKQPTSLRLTAYSLQLIAQSLRLFIP